MENNTKKRYSVNIAGIPLNIITEESEDLVNKTAQELSARIRAITNHSFCVSKLDAAILCALDSLAEANKSGCKVRALEAQLAVLEMDMENLRTELDDLKDKTAPSKPFEQNGEKIKSIENFLDRKING